MEFLVLVLSETVLVLEGMLRTEPIFDQELLGVYRLSLDYVARSFEAAQPREELHRHARDPWRCAAQLIPLNIAKSVTAYGAEIDYGNEHRYT